MGYSMVWKGYKISQGWVLHFHSEFGPPLYAPTHCPWKYRIWRGIHSLRLRYQGLIPLRETFYWKITFGHCERSVYQKNRGCLCVLVWRWFERKTYNTCLYRFTFTEPGGSYEFTITKTLQYHKLDLF